VRLGIVRGVQRERVLVELSARVKRGDGITFATGAAEDQELGGRVYEVIREGRSLDEPVDHGVVALGFKHGALDLAQLQPGQIVWKTDDPELTTRLRKSFTSLHPLRRLPLHVDVVARVGEPLQVVATAAEGAIRAEVASAQPLPIAQKHPLTEQTLREQLGRLGGTAYELVDFVAEIHGQPMIPFSELGKVRHALVAALDAAAQNPPPRAIASESMLAKLRCELPPREVHPQPTPTIHVLARSLAQVRMLLERGIRDLYVDFQDIREYREAVELAHAAGATILLATPRIQKPDEAGIFRVLERHGADGILVRNLGGLLHYHRAGIPMVADFSLNCTNELTAQILREHGVLRITASYDLNRDQLHDLVSAVPPAWLEVVIHQHMPMFHMEHCVFCAVLSPGTNKTNCGRPCDVHEVQLVDRQGMAHPLKADVGCRNTLFNAVPQSAAEAVPSLLAEGLSQFRLELLTDPTPAELDQLLELYQNLLAGRIGGKEVWTRLRAANRVGVTRGTLEERRNPLAIL
jgi:putative protease